MGFRTACGMIVGYVMNSYPMVSTTFIGREIAALEAQGVTVHRYAIRHWDGPLNDPSDLREQGITRYLLTGPRRQLAGAVLACLFGDPRGSLRALRTLRGLHRDAGKGFVRHMAYLAEAMVLARLLARDGVQHVHAHFATNPTAVAMLAQDLGAPGYSFTLHGPDELFVPYHIGVPAKIARARFVACISHYCRAQAMYLSDPAHWDRLRIVHCGVDPARYGGAGDGAGKDGAGKDGAGGIGATDETGVDETGVTDKTGVTNKTGGDAAGPANNCGGRVLFVGRLDAVKGVPLLLDAMARLAADHPDATLTIVGDGVLRGTLEARAAALGLDVAFLGYRRQDEVAALLREVDIFVLPSFAEGVPVVLMEAMAARVPVVAPQVAGVPELVEDGVSGFVVPPGDVDTLTARLDALLRDPARRAAMGRAGRARVAAGFDSASEARWLKALIAGTLAGALPPGLRPQARQSAPSAPSIASITPAGGPEHPS